jgi:arginyl-tRNA synthetase
MRYFDEVYQMLGVLLTSDDIMGESSYHHLLPVVVERLSEQGMLEESEGAQVVSKTLKHKALSLTHHPM